MNELFISSNDVLPEIFFASHKFLNEINGNLDSIFENAKENPEFYSNFNNFITNDWKYLKTGLGDLCVGLKTFGDKLASLGGDSFVQLGNTTSVVVSKTGEFFNRVDNLTIEINELMQQDNNLEKLDEISTTFKNYFEYLSNALNDCSTYTTHLYGDAKEILGENFERLSEGLLRFIQNVKLKCIVGITTICVSLKIALDYLYAQNTLYETKLIEENQISNSSILSLVIKILNDIELAKIETIKVFNN